MSMAAVSGNVFSKGPQFVPGEILIKYKTNLSSVEQNDAIEREGGKRMAILNKKGWARVKIQNEVAMNEAIKNYKLDSNVEYAQPNYIYHATAIPNDPRFAQEWGLKNTAQKIVSPGGPDSPYNSNNPGMSGKDMNMQYAWDITTDCSSVPVAVIDTGINYNQADLAANMWNGGGSYPKHGYDFVDNDNDPMDKNGHGTHVAGTIGAVGNNGIGGTGVCWNASLMAVRVLDATGSGTTANVMAGVNFAVTNGAKVINMSLGGGAYDAAFSSSIDNARSSGVIVVVAAGNDGANNDSGSSPSYPCNYTQDNILCVAALTQNYSLASFSNYGLTSVDVGAPGVNIVSTWPGTHTTLSDPLTSGWTAATNTTTQWGYTSVNTGVVERVLASPSNYGSATYANNTNATIWKGFTVPTFDVAVLNFYSAYDTEYMSDFFSIYAKSGSTSPFSGGTKLDTSSGSSTDYESMSYDISPYISASSTSIGFNLTSDASNNGHGVIVGSFNIETLAYNPNTYNVISGTSMATPHVAGLVAMIKAYNPGYTYADVIESIKNGGVSVSALASNTTTGKAVSGIGSLTYIKKPVGVGAVKLP